MLAPADKVDRGGVHHQQVTGPLIKEEVLVGTHHRLVVPVEIRSSNGTFFFAMRFFSISSYTCKYITKSGMRVCSDY